MPVKYINGNRDKGQRDLSGLQMCLGSISGAPMRPTGLKKTKTTCFRGIVRINTQGSGSSQVVIRCDRERATGSTLFKGQGSPLRECVCVLAHDCVGLFFISYKSKTINKRLSSSDRFLSHCSQCFSGG